MSYSRPVLAGIGLKQKPVATNPVQVGVQQTTLDVDIATTSDVGVVQVGSGLSITPTGILSVTNSGFINVTITSINYIVNAADYYIGAIKKDIKITLPLGIVGKVYIIKNQINGNIEVNTSSGQQIDNALDKTLGSGSSIIVVFDGTRWNVI